MTSVSPDRAFHFEHVTHKKPSAYAKNILQAPQLNPFLMRVRSRDWHHPPTSTLRETQIWIHVSQAEHIPFSTRTRRFESDGHQIIERSSVLFTDHRGLQILPKSFDKVTKVLRRVL